MLSDEQISSFNRFGYLVVDDVLDQKNVLDPVRAEYAQLLDELYAGWFAEGRVSEPPAGLSFHDKLLISYRAKCDWFQPMDISLPGDRIQADTPFHFGPAIFDLVTNERLLDVVEALIGPEITSNPIQHVRIKPPAPDLQKDEIRAHIAATDWHQDRGVTHAEADETRMITVWCAVSDATVENGCLQVLPLAGNDDVYPHCPGNGQLAIADGQIDRDAAVPLPVKSGGVVIFHPLTPHASLENRSGEFRWSFDLRYNVTGEPTGRSHFPEIVARSRMHPDDEMRSWRGWRAMWEAARAELAGQPHIDIHRWDGNAAACA
ncbi:MAG: phytanoyl-CoA dioxygenase family protein [Pseudomonadota bacterium]